MSLIDAISMTYYKNVLISNFLFGNTLICKVYLIKFIVSLTSFLIEIFYLNLS